MRTGALSARGPALAQRRGKNATPLKAMAPLRRRPTSSSSSKLTTTTRTTTSTSSSSSSSVPRAASAAGGGGSAAADDDDDDNSDKKTSSSFLSKLKNLFGGGEKLDRERLKALGTGAVASYGFISNVTYGGGMAVSWVGFVKKYAVSPLAAGQWPKFLAFYSAFWMAQNFVRPLRFSAALALAPAFDRFIDFLSSRLRVSRPRAFGVYLFLLGAVTCTLVFGGIFLACGPAAYAR